MKSVSLKTKLYKRRIINIIKMLNNMIKLFNFKKTIKNKRKVKV